MKTNKFINILFTNKPTNYIKRIVFALVLIIIPGTVFSLTAEEMRKMAREHRAKQHQHYVDSVARAEARQQQQNYEMTKSISPALIVGVCFVIGMIIFVASRNRKEENITSANKSSKSPIPSPAPSSIHTTNVISNGTLVGKVIFNKYQIKSVLGQGGFGVTYLAEQLGLQRKVAVKEFFMKEYSERSSYGQIISITESARQIVDRCRQKFVKEARLIASLDNPHIVRVHDIFDENGTAYYVMDYIEGCTLSELVRRNSLSESTAVNYIKQIGEALAYIHSRNVLHLDVKPSNILIKPNGTAVLIDFGISKGYDSVGEQTTTTPAGRSKGYAPIEQYSQDLTHFTPATDVYSLAATLYFAITGLVPPEATIISEEGLGAGRYKMSDQTYSAIVVAMQQNRNNRPQSVAAFIKTLDNNDEETIVANI